MSTKHTPGPWKQAYASVKGKKQWISIKASRKNKDGEGLLIADIIIDENEMPIGETEANAALMIAAPELLAFTKEVIGHYLKIDKSHTALMLLVHKAAVLYEKATGEFSGVII